MTDCDAGAGPLEPRPPRVALIHALRQSVDPIGQAFSELWPQARTFNLLDDSLSADLAASGEPEAVLADRFLTLAGYAVEVGSDAILFTCSAFNDCIDRCKAVHTIPVLKPDEAMLEDALDDGGSIGMLCTFAPTRRSFLTQLEALADLRGRTAAVEAVHVPDALDALAAGDAATHDRLLATAAAALDTDLVVLAQFSMARARETVASTTGRRVLTSPDAAVRKLRTLLGSELSGPARSARASRERLR